MMYLVIVFWEILLHFIHFCISRLISNWNNLTSYTITIQIYKVTEIYHYPLSYLIQLIKGVLFNFRKIKIVPIAWIKKISVFQKFYYALLTTLDLILRQRVNEYYQSYQIVVRGEMINSMSDFYNFRGPLGSPFVFIYQRLGNSLVVRIIIL